jgi:hypothetical protein
MVLCCTVTARAPPVFAGMHHCRHPQAFGRLCDRASMRGGIENPSRGGHGQHAMRLFETMSLAQLGLVVWRVSVGCCFVCFAHGLWHPLYAPPVAWWAAHVIRIPSTALCIAC